MRVSELAAGIGKTATFRTRLVYFGLGVMGLFFPGYATVLVIKGVLTGMFESAPMNTWPGIVEEVMKHD